MVAHGSHKPSFIFDEIPRYTDPGSHNPMEHKGPVDPSGRDKTKTKDKDIPLAKAKKMLRFYCLEFSQFKILI